MSRPRNVPRSVNRNDLYSFAVFGDFYQRHLELGAACDIDLWREHVMHAVVPRYCIEIEPVRCSIKTMLRVARDLMYYYRAHVAEIREYENKVHEERVLEP